MMLNFFVHVLRCSVFAPGLNGTLIAVICIKFVVLGGVVRAGGTGYLGACVTAVCGFRCGRFRFGRCAAFSRGRVSAAAAGVTVRIMDAAMTAARAFKREFLDFILCLLKECFVNTPCIDNLFYD